VALRYLAAGTYYVEVVEFAPAGDTAADDYQLSLSLTASASCTSVASCAAEYGNQLFRGLCKADGACGFRAGLGAGKPGDACDSDDDCDLAATTACAAFPFTAGLDTRGVCTVVCTTDAECSALGSGARCSAGLVPNLCLPPCTNDDQCPTKLRTPPPPGKPWFHLTCNDSTTRCEL
jgi:hypothetical protein